MYQPKRSFLLVIWQPACVPPTFIACASATPPSNENFHHHHGQCSDYRAFLERYFLDEEELSHSINWLQISKETKSLNLFPTSVLL